MTSFEHPDNAQMWVRRVNRDLARLKRHGQGGMVAVGEDAELLLENPDEGIVEGIERPGDFEVVEGVVQTSDGFEAVIEAPVVPSNPIIEVVMTAVNVRWDGLGQGGEHPPDSFWKLVIHRSTVADFDADVTTVVGEMFGPGQVTFTDQDYGIVHYYRFVMLTTHDESGQSGTAAATATKVTSGDVTFVTGDGKNTVTYSTSPPGSTPNVAGDTWFVRSLVNGAVTAQYEGLGGTSWASRTLSHEVIASIDAGTIIVGTLTGIDITGVNITGATITGTTFRTAVSGSRWEIEAGAGIVDTIYGYHDTAVDPAEIVLDDDQRLLPEIFIKSPRFTAGSAVAYMGFVSGDESGNGSRIHAEAEILDLPAIGFEAPRISPNQSVLAATVTAIQWAAPSLNKGQHGWVRQGTTGANAALWVCPADGVYHITAGLGFSATPTPRGFVQLYCGAAKSIRIPCTGEVVAGAAMTGFIAAGDTVKLEAFSSAAFSVTGGFMHIYKEGF